MVAIAGQSFDFSFDVEGSDSAPTLLLVHGILSSRKNWLPNRERILEHFRVVRIDLPAHGTSQPFENSALVTPDRLVDALERLRSRLGLDRWMICGQSAGVGLTMRYALRYPDRVIAQAFTNANAVLRSFPDEAALTAHAARIAILRDPTMNGIERERTHPKHAKRFDPWIRDLLVEDVARIDSNQFADFIDVFLPQISLRDYLGNLAVPTILINGRHEHRFQPHRDWLAARQPNIEIVDLDGGHSINIENPMGFDGAIIEFFSRYSSPSGIVRRSRIRSVSLT